MDSYTEQLKRMLLAAVLHYRLEELNWPALSRNLVQIDFCVGDPGGRAVFEQSVKDFFVARAIDLEETATPEFTFSDESSFRSDAATFAATLIAPQVVFEAPAPETTRAVVGRLLRSQGWHLRSGDHSEQWRAGLIDVASGRDLTVRSGFIRRLLNDHWVFSKPEPDTFDDMPRWWKRICGVETLKSAL
jgi:hypothetical protein